MRVLDLFCGLGGATAAWRERGHEVVGVDMNPDVLHVDREHEYAELVEADVMDLTLPELRALGPFDYIHASPPCQTFSVLTISNYWDKDGNPKHPLTYQRIALVKWTLYLIQALEPRAWTMENPTGMLRAQRFMQPYERRTVTYCQYGLPFRKSTDLWGGFPPTLTLREPCSPGSSCHAASPQVKKNGHHLIRDLFGDVNERRGGRKAYGDEPLEDDREEEPLVKNVGGGAPHVVPQVNLKEAWAGLTSDVHELRESKGMRSALRSLVPYELSLEVCEAMEAWDGGGSWRAHAPRITDYAVESEQDE